MLNNSKIENELKSLRKEIFLTGYSAINAHYASAYSILEILYALYAKKIMKFDISNPNMRERDRLVLSKGHGSLALYALLKKVGFISCEDMKKFCKPGGILGGEPNMLEMPGVEASTGSLGHGLSIGVGMALANKCDHIDSKTYVILGDGECQEGSIWEGVMTASQFELENLVVILDDNRLQKMGKVSEIMGIDSWDSRWESFGWCVSKVDGHDVDKLCTEILKSGDKNKPRLIIANTIKGKGVSIMENNPKWHWKVPSKKELKVIMRELEISAEEIEKCKELI